MKKLEFTQLMFSTEEEIYKIRERAFFELLYKLYYLGIKTQCSIAIYRNSVFIGHKA